METQLFNMKKPCLKQNHSSQNLLIVCVEKQCHGNALCCCSCVDEEHQSHQLMSLRKFEAILKQKLQKNGRNKQRYVIAKYFQDQRSKFLNGLKQLQNCLVAKISCLEQQINQKITEVIESLTIPSHDEVIQTLSDEKDTKSWSQIFQKMQLCQRINIGNLKETEIVMNHQLGVFESKIIQSTNDIISKLDDLQIQIQEICFNSKRYEEPPTFHPFYKYFDMQRLDDKCFVQKKKNNGNRTAALGNRPLDPVNNSVKFNIIKNGDGIPSICVGAAILSILKRNNFTNCTGSKRGVYCIDQASTSNWGSIQPSNVATFWNHDIQQPNSSIGFQFNQGDTVEMTVDFQTGTIIFQVGQQIFDMEIDSSHRDLYPFVCMNNSNSVVQILE